MPAAALISRQPASLAFAIHCLKKARYREEQCLVVNAAEVFHRNATTGGPLPHLAQLHGAALGGEEPGACNFAVCDFVEILYALAHERYDPLSTRGLCCSFDQARGVRNMARLVEKQRVENA